MRRRTRHLILLAGLALLGALAPAAANASPCAAKGARVLDSGKSISVCSFVVNRTLVFGAKPGEIVPGTIERAGTRVEAGNQGAESASGEFPWNHAAWNTFEFGFRNPVGITWYRLLGVDGMFQHEVGVKADYNRFYLEGEFARGLTCVANGYLTCTAPAVWSHSPAYEGCFGIFSCIERPVMMVDAPATIETRPLIVKILNMTDQPLVRSSDPSLTGVVRDERIEDPSTIAAGTDGRTGAGYYHLLRDPSRADGVAMSYVFADGAGATSLTGRDLNIDVVVGEDGSTAQSSCSASSSGAVAIQCDVTVLGDADGILEAVVTVGV